jgi:AcrR family transcriptional regulator
MPKIPQTLKENRREAILQAAVDCMGREGLAGTTMRSIAQAVGLTKGGLYPYFENKEAILLAVAERYLERHLTILEPREGVDAATQLAEFVDTFMTNTLDPATAAAQRGMLDLWLSAEEIPAVRAFVEARFDGLVKSLASLVRRGQDEGLFRREVEAEHVAGLVLAARDGMVSQRLRIRADLPVDGMARVLREMLLGCLLIPEGESRPPARRPRPRAGAGAP